MGGLGRTHSRYEVSVQNKCLYKRYNSVIVRVYECMYGFLYIRFIPQEYCYPLYYQRAEVLIGAIDSMHVILVTDPRGRDSKGSIIIDNCSTAVNVIRVSTLVTNTDAKILDIYFDNWDCFHSASTKKKTRLLTTESPGSLLASPRPISFCTENEST